jgi:flagellar hook protein FlgE
MISSINAALSALGAFQKKLSVSANNIANAATPGFKRSDVNMIEAAAGGVEAVIEPVPIPGVSILEDTPQGPALVEQSNVELGEEMVNLIVAQRGFQANVRVLQAQNEALGTLLDRRD